jgi:hypothetical protein
VADEPTAREQHIGLTVDFGLVQSLDVSFIEVTYDFQRVIACLFQSSCGLSRFRPSWVHLEVHVGVNEPALGLVADYAGDVSAARRYVEYQVPCIAALPVHFACSPPVIRSPMLYFGEQCIGGFEKVTLRTLVEAHGLECIPGRPAHLSPMAESPRPTSTPWIVVV